MLTQLSCCILTVKICQPELFNLDPNSMHIQWDAVLQEKHQENTDMVKQMFVTLSVKFKTPKIKHEKSIIPKRALK